MFKTLTMAPPDAILGLNEAFNRDSNPDKVNLGVGVYKDPSGNTPVLRAVKEAERILFEKEKSKAYRPITGDPVYSKLVQELLFGADHSVIKDGRAVGAHCPGGTGSLRVSADFLKRSGKNPTVWIPTPTWANHRAIFTAAGLPVEAFPYFDAKANALDWESFRDALKKIPSGNVVLLHGCCHNPTGVDPEPEHWKEIATILGERELLPILDFAYQGFGTGLEEDAFGMRTLVENLPEVIVCSSFSKNFGLYNERTGALTIISDSKASSDLVMSNLKSTIRSNYSNPPAHGASIVRTVLEDAKLKQDWLDELAEMRNRIHSMRALFAKTLSDKGADMDGSFIMKQKGMFSMSGLSKEHAVALREKHSVYIVDSGRINVAGMTENNMDRICSGIASVL